MTVWGIGTKFKIVSNPHMGVCTIDSYAEGSDYPYGISWAVGPSGINAGSNKEAYSKEGIDRAFADGVWTIVEEEKKETTLPSVGDTIRVTGAEFISDLSESLDGDIHKVIEVRGDRVYVNTKGGGKIYVNWEPVDRAASEGDNEKLRTENESLKVELANVRNGAANFRQEMLNELAKQAEKPDCECDSYCESFDAFMIRRGYSREEVEEAREGARPMEEYEITIRITGRAGVGGEANVAQALRDHVSQIDSDWEGTDYDYNLIEND